jgi:hypothetical protein
VRRAAVSGASVAQRPGPDSRKTLRYGLLELAPLPLPRIFVGTLTMSEGQLVLEAAEGQYLLDVHTSFAADPRFYDQRVSVLGFLGEQTPPSAAGAASITAMKLISHEAVSLRAYEIHESCREGGAVDNWLRAQWELLAR